MEQQSIPKGVNCSPRYEYTLAPSLLLQNPNLSYMAKAIMCLILSLEAERIDVKKQGWTGQDLVKYMKEDTRAIQAALAELKQSGWLVGDSHGKD